MTPAAPRVRLPISLEDSDLRSLVDSVFYVFGSDLEGKAAPPFMRVYGKEWEQELAKERVALGRAEQRRFSGRDPSAVLAALLDNATVLREVATKDPKLQGNLENSIRKTLKLRHGFYHFDWPEHGARRVRQALGEIRDCASKLTLKVASDIDATLDRIQRLESGEEVAAPTFADLEELQRQRREGDRALALFQEERDQALQEAEVSAELAQMYDRDRQALAVTAERERAELAAAANKARSAMEEAEQRAAEADARQAAALEQLKELTGSVKTLEDRLALAEAAAGRRPNDRAIPLPMPGEPWPFVRGVRRMTLSVAAGDVVDEDRGALGVADLAQKWLAFRPSGGRVWVDEDGDACTLLDGDLIYLGRLPALTIPALTPGGPPPQPGEVVDLPHREGRKLTLHIDGHITDRGGADRRLASVIPKDRALATGQMLLRHFPGAGVIYQRRDGLLTRDLGEGGCLVLGHVHDVAWFPDLLVAKG